MTPTPERVREVFDYNPDTGVLVRRRLGKPVTGLSSKGYIHAVLDGKLVFAHRLAWLHHHGEIPEGALIDHANRVKTDNRICNLRLATRSQNQANRDTHPRNTSGFTGVTKVTRHYKRWGTSRDWWLAQARWQGKTHYLGTYPTPEEASLAYQRFVAEHHQEFAGIELFS